MTAIGQTKSTSTKEEYIESIDALFLKLELAYHYQFYKVFGTDEKLKEGKKLWAVTLKNETPEVILEAVESVISSQSYLPTLTDLMKACNEINKMDGFPTAEEAYIEARKSYQPRAEFEWSHPIVYSSENLKTFKKIFNSLKNDALNGKKFEIKDNTFLDTRKPLNKGLFNKLRKKHKV